MPTLNSLSPSKNRVQQTNDVVPITMRIPLEQKTTFQQLAHAKGLSYGQLLIELLQIAQTTALLPWAAPLPSELHKLPLDKRNAILQAQATSAATLYAANPELIADGSDDVNLY
jgi:hypothetical protein